MFRRLVPLTSNLSVRLSSSQRLSNLKDGPDLSHFIKKEKRSRMAKIIPPVSETDSYLTPYDLNGHGRKVKLITYGCQMNVNDMELVRSILKSSGYRETGDSARADIVLLMTCSIREGAEQKVWNALKKLKKEAKVPQTRGVLGCMAERVRHGLLEKDGLCDLVAGPDSYRDLTRLLAITTMGRRAINVQLSLEETYADLSPVRSDMNSKTAFVSIMRGCDNMCTYCIVPFTRGRERSRPIDSIVEEVRRLSDQGVRQVVLLGQNVNSYRDSSESSFVVGDVPTVGTVPGFNTIYKPKQGGRTFVTLLDEISRIDPELRIRFTSPHPKDFPMPVLDLIAERANICNQLHLPAQSGDNETLERMGRGYTREAYLELVDTVKATIPGVALTSDFIAGFCGETEEAHQQTLELIRRVGYEFCFVFPYSMREKTKANYKLTDDVPDEVKSRRHLELAAVFREGALKLHTQMIGSQQLILIEGTSRRDEDSVFGRSDEGSKVIVKKELENGELLQPGDYAVATIVSATSQTMLGEALYRTSLQNWAAERELLGEKRAVS